MRLNSKFESLYIVRKIIVPIIYAGLGILLLNHEVKINREVENNYGIDYLAVFLLVLAVVVLFFNLNSIYKIRVEETKIIRVFILSGKTEIIPYTFIKSAELEFNEGIETDAGQLNSGFYKWIFNLESNKQLIVSPEYFENYKQLMNAINHNRNET